MSDKLILVFITCPPDRAESIAEILVTEKLAACVNISTFQSVYIWQDKLNKDPEALLIVKTKNGLYDNLERRIKEIHPYDVPEIVAVNSEQVEPKYLSWVTNQTA